MYWNHCWISIFDKKSFFNKTLFIEDIIGFIFSEKIFSYFFKKKFLQDKIKKIFLTNLLSKNIDKTYFKNKNSFKRKATTKKYNFSKVWLVKYNNYILVSIFFYFFFKIRKKKQIIINKKKFFLQKIPTIFLKKKKNSKFLKKQFLSLLNKDKYLFF